MAKRKKPADPRDEYADLCNDLDAEQACSWPSVCDYCDEWRLKLNTIVEQLSKKTGLVSKKQLADARAALVQVEILERTNHGTMFLEAAVRLGIIFERMSLRPIEPWIGRSRRVSESAKRKGSMSARLNDDQWEKIRHYLQGQVKSGLSVSEACRRVSNQLKTGTFQGIRERIVFSADGIRKRYNKRPASRKH